MPLPTPRKSESKEKFISRCMRTLNNMSEGKDQSQRAGICYSQWNRRKAKEALLETSKELKDASS